MKQLLVAATADQIPELERRLSDATAGRWRQYVRILPLSDNKSANDLALRNVPATHPDGECFADKNVTSRFLEDSGIDRMARPALINKTIDWLDRHRISWRGNVEECRRHGSYKWMDVEQWRQQFARVDPDTGPRVASAILAQLQIVGMQQLGGFLTDELEEASFSTFFMGADPQSGDHGVASMLNQLINNQKLAEAFKLPVLEPASRIRMFNDGGWSGGESIRRISCMYRKCDRKACHIDPSHSLEMRFAFITDIAEEELASSISQIEVDFNVTKGSITISYPSGNRLNVKDGAGVATGLAFRDPQISNYVSSAEMQQLCSRIGKKIIKRRPLGTHKIASTIGFWHSLPKAMLPVLILGGGPVQDCKGDRFSWHPLIVSQHVLNPQEDVPGYHCNACPLAPRDRAEAVAQA